VHRQRQMHSSGVHAPAAAAEAAASNSSTMRQQGQQGIAAAASAVGSQLNSNDAEIPAHIQRELTQLRT
jgi:hypothetical protein